MMLEYIGKFEKHPVTIDGYEVPLIDAREANHGTECHIRLDERFGIAIPAEHAAQVLWLIANAIAIGAGYSCHGENSVYRPNPFHVKVMGISTVTDSSGDERIVGEEP